MLKAPRTTAKSKHVPSPKPVGTLIAPRIPGNPPYPKHVLDHRAQQLDPQNEAYWLSRGLPFPIMPGK
jgi:hypothetical protein